MSFADLCQLDADSGVQDRWIGEYRARWAAHRAAASVSTGDGGAWLDGDAAREVVCDAMVIPVVSGDIDPAAVEDLITLCVCYHQLRTQAAPADPDAPGPTDTLDRTTAQDRIAAQDASDVGGPLPAGLAGPAARRAEVTATAAAALAELEQQILGKILQVVSGPGGAASFLRRHLLGKPLGGPSLPLDVGQSDEIPVHLRRLVALRDQTCQYPGGCDQPASGCEPHHVKHRSEGGHTSLTNLKDYCWWHHHVVLHELGWTLTVHPDGTSQVQSPDGKIIRSHSPPPRPG
ncbi:MAG TPA: HNH endonuclease signature motif containing protein [Streptosporangiaceae bacterium]|nr:HNH endonuclease signature motif containing protein [Streptosporangiaceae bacterium]